MPAGFEESQRRQSGSKHHALSPLLPRTSLSPATTTPDADVLCSNSANFALLLEERVIEVRTGSPTVDRC